VITTPSNSESFKHIRDSTVAIVPMHLVHGTLEQRDHIEDYVYNETRFAIVSM